MSKSEISVPLTVYCNVVSCFANVLLHTLNDVAQTGGGGIVQQWSRRQSVALSAVIMCFEVSWLSPCCHYYFILTNFLLLLKTCVYIRRSYHKDFYWLVHCIFHPLIPLTSLFSDWADYDRVGDCCEPACWGVGGNPGVGDHPTSPVWPRPDWHEEPGQQLLPQLRHASALHHSRLPEQVSTLFYSDRHPPVSHTCYIDNVTLTSKGQC